MNSRAKQLFEKMVDFKRFAIILLAVGAFFYLGVFIPSSMNSPRILAIKMIASSSFIALSLVFFVQSKKCRTKLIELEEAGNDYREK